MKDLFLPGGSEVELALVAGQTHLENRYILASYGEVKTRQAGEGGRGTWQCVLPDV